ncbi:two-component system phosphate regulon sensor histidine kinase PhoR [Salsuginibacillus halophilus]|uniref:histidine kinase n=1 Tax=Salsuginibacillus halophilus TaxID=517424 RepID=A0A2P8HCX3_9BACI|nr:ATP-binding protein [Salsuginibacillus halophilus]PSL44069.1 two-component system phosphate regulon sensor histidine kinase PhoR [Salsuginibacillus halophilus]
MRKFSQRLILSIMLIVLFVLGGAGFVMGQILNNAYLEQIEERLENEAELAAMYVAQTDASNDEAVQQAAERLGLRLTLYDRTGSVVSDSLESSNTGSAMPEEGTDIAYSEAIGEEALNVTALIDHETDTDGWIRLALPVSETAGITRSIWVGIGATFTTAFLFILMLSYRVAGQIVAPVSQVKRAASKLAEGDFKVRVQKSSSDEIGDLTDSMNVLAKNLDQLTSRYKRQQERMETLIEHMGSGLMFIDHRGRFILMNWTAFSMFRLDEQTWQDQLYYDVLENDDLIESIQHVFFTEESVHRQIHMVHGVSTYHYDIYAAPVLSQSEKLRGTVVVLHDITELKRLEKVRKDFVANVSHELKTPVTSIKGFAETLLDGAMDVAEHREEFIRIIQKESTRLEELVVDLLELSKIEQGNFNITFMAVELDQVFEEARALMAKRAEEAGIELVVDAPVGLVIAGDASRMKQIAINLITNAIMYTPAGGTVRMSAAEHAEEVEVCVVDTGVGIDPEEIPRIFERFYRVDKTRSRHSGGTGLGLAIVKHLVDAHNGQIKVESQPGEGTTFRLFFKKKTN